MQHFAKRLLYATIHANTCKLLATLFPLQEKKSVAVLPVILKGSAASIILQDTGKAN